MKALDLFCCGGGATRGLQRAGFQVVGVDNDKSVEKYYPAEFIHQDVMAVDVEWIADNFDYAWASPPCQKFSTQTKQHGTEDNHPDLVEPTRQMLLRTGLPFTLENVMGAPLRKDLVLCGKMFDLGVARHRLFENHGFTAEQPEHRPHDGEVITVTGHAGGKSKRDGSSRFGSTADWRRVMDIPDLPGRCLTQAIPPAYSEYIATQLIKEWNA